MYDRFFMLFFFRSCSCSSESFDMDSQTWEELVFDEMLSYEKICCMSIGSSFFFTSCFRGSFAVVGFGLIIFLGFFHLSLGGQGY